MHSLKKFTPDKSWFVFLDRDGVINKKITDASVLKPDDFKFVEGVKESIKWFSDSFARIFIVTNQQAVGDGKMTKKDLEDVHDKMLGEIRSSGGNIDKIYFCTTHDNTWSYCKKPSPGMAVKAKKDFPEIDFRKSIMVGDSLNDMKFGKRMKMITVFIGNEKKTISTNYRIIDYAFPRLKDFRDFLEKKAIGLES